jgi:hypothetical protein
LKSWRILSILALIGLVAACGGSSGDATAAGGAGGGSASGGGSEPAAGGGSGAGNIGPDTMPDREAEPVQFLYWRIDRMWEEHDADGDGKLSTEEYAGEPYNFERIDTDADGFLTKQEIIDDMTPVLREEGRIP